MITVGLENTISTGKIWLITVRLENAISTGKIYDYSRTREYNLYW